MDVCCQSASCASVFMPSENKRIADYGLGVVMQYSLYVVIKCRINKMLGEK